MTNSPTNARRWDDVEIGDRVELKKNGAQNFEGVVDARTADGGVVWVIAPPEHRRLFHMDDGYDLKAQTA